MRPVFVGNFEYETRQGELERLFLKYGRVERIDMKSGYAFVYFEDDRDAADSIQSLDNLPFGHDRRPLSVEWARGEKARDGAKTGNQRPTKTLFIINFDPVHTRTRDLERHFEPYGKIVSVRIRRNFGFVQFETQEEATTALERAHMSKLLDRVISVEYSLRDEDERNERFSGPRRGGYGRRSPSPARRRSPSPARRRSPIYRNRPSPDYGRGPRRSPSYDRFNDDHAYNRSYSPENPRHRRR